jgi:hypothetical protein
MITFGENETRHPFAVTGGRNVSAGRSYVSGLGSDLRADEKLAGDRHVGRWQQAGRGG